MERLLSKIQRCGPDGVPQERIAAVVAEAARRAAREAEERFAAEAAYLLRVFAGGRPPLAESEGQGEGLVLAQVICMVFQ